MTSHEQLVPRSNPDVARRLTQVANSLDQLAVDSLQPWLDVGLDPEGGAYGFLDRDFTPLFWTEGDELGPSRERRGDQSLVQQARHLFSYSLMHARRPGDERLVTFAHDLYGYLRRGFLRRRSDGRGSMPPESTRPRPFLHWVPRGGARMGVEGVASSFEQRGQAVVAPEPGRDFDEQQPYSPFSVQLYAQGFAVYALATYALIFDVPPAATWARALFLSLDEVRHDEEFGGYDQSEDGGWLAFAGAPEGSVKCTNTHIHLLEALTPLVRAFPVDELMTRRLAELADLIATKLAQPGGYVHKFFARDWSPVGPKRCSYGHDLETSWLLLDALDALREAECVSSDLEAVVTAASQAMARHGVEQGGDEAGGVFDEGIPVGVGEEPRVTNHDKVWWAQAEAIPGIYRLYQAQPSEELLVCLERTFHFLAEKSWDAKGGEYFWGVDSEGHPAARGVHKGEMWKTPYHALRACLITADWILEDLAEKS